MNKTISINLSGTFFHIEEHAYEHLDAYLDSISDFFANERGVKEMMQDIEGRIAEMFTENLRKYKREVVLVSDVRMMTKIMGLPEEFDDPYTARFESAREDNYTNEYMEFDMEEEDYSDRWSRKRKKVKKKLQEKRLYRNPDDKIIAGVCSGLSAYFKIKDPIWVRIAFTLSIFGGYGILVYFLLWTVVPKAKSPAQKLRMRGERMSIYNIEKAFQDHFDVLKSELKDFERWEKEKWEKEKWN